MYTLLKQKIKGQATVEYVLLMIVIVGIFILAVAKFYTPFRDWSKFQLGGYVYCLLDQGTLPALDGSASDGFDCEPPDIDWGPGRGKGAGAQASAGDKATGGGANKKSPRSRSGGTRGGGGSSGSGRSSDVYSKGARSADGKAGEKDPTSQKEEVGVATPSKFYKFNNRRAFSNQYLTKRLTLTNPPPFLLAQIRQREERERTPQVLQMKNEASNSGRVKKLQLKKPERKNANIEERVQSMDFSKIFRYVIIISILIALLLFVAGQVRQITKSMD